MLADAGSLINRPAIQPPAEEGSRPHWSPRAEKNYGQHIDGSGAEAPSIGSPSSSYTSRPAWPLSSVGEAQLLRYYVTHIAPWFDVCDRFQHFSAVIPQRAAFCPPLLQAIFTVAARHLSLSRPGYDPYAADRYHEICLAYLRRVINDPAMVMDENLFAATVVLRFLEEIDSKFNYHFHYTVRS